MKPNHYIHNLNPIAIDLGPFSLSWYWASYFVGFIGVLFIVYRLNKTLELSYSRQDIADYFQWSWPALFLGSRIFYILVYNLKFFMENPHMIPKIWLGGMSFHGALIGIIAAIYLTAKKKQQSFLRFTDLIATVAPLALALGRVTNFINGELAGRVTNVPWAVIFPRYKDGLPRHPSQLYQAFFEGLLLFLILWANKKNLKKYHGLQSSIFLIGYGIFRFFVEFFRAPDSQLGHYLFHLTMGQWLCIAMIGIGIFVLFKKRPACFIGH